MRPAAPSGREAAAGLFNLRGALRATAKGALATPLKPPSSAGREAAAGLLALLAAAALSLLPALVAAPGPARVTLNLGPNDADYIRGFHREYEIVGPVATRWTTHHAGVELPLSLRGGVELSYRFARVLPQTAVVEVRLAGQLVDRFTCRGGHFETRRVRLGALPAMPLRVDFGIDSHDRTDRGLLLDWVRLEVGEGGAMGARGLARWRPTLLVIASFLLFRAAGWGSGGALLLAAPVSLAQAAWAFSDPFGLAHVGAKIALPAVLFSALSVALFRGRPGRRWLTPIFLAGYLLKGAGVFYPSYFYPDVQNHRRYVFALSEATGSIPERGLKAQVKVNTAYPRYVAGRPYAFPYSPLFFVPFTWLPRDEQLVEDAMRQVALFAAAAQVMVVFWLAGLVFGPRSGVAAAFLAASLSPAYSRLLLAMWPTLAGSLLDTLAIGAAILVASHPSARRLFGFAALTLASFLTYISSLFNLGGFVAFWAVLDRRLAPRLLVVLAVTGGATVALLYLPFTLQFFREILPRLWAGEEAGAGAAPAPGLLAALRRIPLFYGYGYPSLALAGLVLARRRAPPAVFRVVGAYGLTFVLLVLLRGLAGALFKDLKEITFVAPLVALTAGASLEALAGRDRSGQVAAALITLGLVAFGLERYAFYLATYRSAVGASP